MFKKYVREDELVEITQKGRKVNFSFALYPEFYHDPETSHYLARFATFRAQVGSGPSEAAALNSLEGVFQAYIDVFIESAGLEAFEVWLHKHGFEVLSSDDLADDWSRGSEKVSFQAVNT